MASTSKTIRNFRTEIGGEQTSPTEYTMPTITGVDMKQHRTFWRIRIRAFTPPTGWTVGDEVTSFLPIKDQWYDNKPITEKIYGWIIVDSGIEGGKVRAVSPTIVTSGKNLGRSNATNVWCQTLREALSMYSKQSKKSVSAEQKLDIELFPPMLATKLTTELEDKTQFWIQRKYNGLRAVAAWSPVAGVVMYSRKRQLFPGLHINKAELAPILKDNPTVYLDGEIYDHGTPLQTLSGEARNTSSTFAFTYMIYDAFVPTQPNMLYVDRLALLKSLNIDTPHVKTVETFESSNPSEAIAASKKYIAEGYEGAMVRLNAPYAYSYNDYHCKVLLKIKQTLDAEFKLVGFTSGRRGKAVRALMLKCVTPEGKEFDVTPALELSVREQLFVKLQQMEPNGKTIFANRFAGHMLTVTFDEYSVDKVPQRARTSFVFRNENDEYYTISAD